jgi:hypothetical protein
MGCWTRARRSPFTGSRIATLGQYENFGTVTGTPPTGPPVTDIDVSHHVGISPPSFVMFDRRGLHAQPTDLP